MGLTQCFSDLITWSDRWTCSNEPRIAFPYLFYCACPSSAMALALWSFYQTQTLVVTLIFGPPLHVCSPENLRTVSVSYCKHNGASPHHATSHLGRIVAIFLFVNSANGCFARQCCFTILYWTASNYVTYCVTPATSTDARTASLCFTEIVYLYMLMNKV